MAHGTENAIEWPIHGRHLCRVASATNTTPPTAQPVRRLLKSVFAGSAQPFLQIIGKVHFSVLLGDSAVLLVAHLCTKKTEHFCCEKQTLHSISSAEESPVETRIGSPQSKKTQSSPRLGTK